MRKSPPLGIRKRAGANYKHGGCLMYVVAGISVVIIGIATMI
ncbi:hypothetical protein JOC34_000505 [Virgibacillus halotolerans]|nr:hypothetical protein [Virgibacillus halotolerans]MBM7598148.1 hypothetical protein [Virgibacillus halotolerans]